MDLNLCREEQLGDALIEDGAIVAAALWAQGATKPTFADAGRPIALRPILARRPNRITPG